ncbi:MAG: DUF2809 domain-containing protein [Bacteroidales bacterium]|nr:DUF2809 domain-containing protein [Bacteroidales bacterium]
MKAKNSSQIINYLILIVIASCLGILSRMYGSILPDVVASYAGDTMWAFALYFVIALFSLKRTFGFRFLLTLILSFIDEFSQLYHAPWVDGIRNTTVGALLLGNTFVWSDLLCYLAGAVMAVVVDYTFIKTRR